MELFQTPKFVDQLVDYTIASKLKEKQGDIDVGITEIKEEGLNTRTLQTNLFNFGETLVRTGLPLISTGIGAYALGKKSKNNSNDDKGGGSSSGSSSISRSEQSYKEAEKKFEELQNNNVKIITRSVGEQVKDAIVQSYSTLSSNFSPVIPVITNLGTAGLALATIF